MSSSSSLPTDWSLLETGKKRVMTDLIGSSHAEGQWVVLIVDGRTLRIVSSCTRMYDVMEENVTVVEHILKPRQPLPSLPAVYFLSPTDESVDALIRDWSEHAKYASAHVFFSNALPDALLKRVAASPARPHVKSLKELNFDFLAVEPRCFHLDTPAAMYRLYSPESPSLLDECSSIAARLASLCVSMNEYPVIRYEHTERDVARRIAAQLQERLDDLFRRGVYAPALTARACLLVVGRTVDPVSPILSEFTYQAMAHHLLKVENNHYKFKYAGADKEVVLDDHDSLWPTLRHMHVADAINWVIANFNSFLAANKGATVAKAGAKAVASLKEMREAMQAMPEFFELLTKYALHMAIAGDCMAAFQKRQMMRIAQLEQDLATGFDASGAEAKNVMSTLPPILTDPSVSVEDKKRLIMLFIISQEGMKEQDRRRMMEYASLSAKDQAAISNLYYLGVTLNKSIQRSSKKKKKKDKRPPAGAEDVPYELSRFVPRVKGLFRDLISNQLSAEAFPWIKEGHTPGTASSPTTVGDKSGLKSNSAHPKWADSKGKGPAGAPAASAEDAIAAGNPRYIIFVAGGMTYSEMRSAYEVSKHEGRHCYIGSTHILTPQTFVDALGDLKKL